jgi:hypothetical protein
MSQFLDISRGLSDANSSMLVKSGVDHTVDVQVVIEYTRRTAGVFNRLKTYWLRIIEEISSSFSKLC